MFMYRIDIYIYIKDNCYAYFLLYSLAIIHCFFLKYQNKNAATKIITSITIIKPIDMLPRLVRSTPFIPYIPAIKVGGNNITVKIVRVFIVSFICNIQI